MMTTLLQAAPGGGGLMSFLPMILIVVVFYFFMIITQMKKQKEHKKYIEELGINSKIVTTALNHGRIVEVSETRFLVDVGSGMIMHFANSAVAIDASTAA